MNWWPLYFTRLRQEVGVTANPNPKRRHQILLEQLINTPYEWSVPNDDNRLEDGLNVRYEFLESHGLDISEGADISCSVLEMLIALCRRLVFQAEGTVEEWFWELMTNLDLEQFDDEYYEFEDNATHEVDDILQNFIQRRYAWNGQGGLFPLRHSRRDQSKIEVWYQMADYLHENHTIVDMST